MKPWIIIGGGVAGLVAAKILKQNSVEFVGIEGSDRLGGRGRVGHHRLYESASVDFLNEIGGVVDWERVDDPPQERKKGEWRQLSEEMSGEEQFYLKGAFFQPREPYEKLVDKLAAEVSEKFQLRTAALEILPTEKEDSFERRERARI